MESIRYLEVFSKTMWMKQQGNVKQSVKYCNSEWNIAISEAGIIYERVPYNRMIVTHKKNVVGNTQNRFNIFLTPLDTIKDF